MLLNINEDMYKLLYNEGKKFDQPIIQVNIEERVLLKKLKSYKFKQEGKPKAFKFKHTRDNNTKTQVAILLRIEDGSIIWDREF
jgi:hypothetical protein